MNVILTKNDWNYKTEIDIIIRINIYIGDKCTA